MRKFKHKQTDSIAKQNTNGTYNIYYKEEYSNSVIKAFIENTLDWIEIKEPVFTTADGVDMFEGDMYYFVDIKYGNVTYNVVVKLYDNTSKNKLRFSTRELAQEYLDFNAPKYSLKDITDAQQKSISLSDMIQKLINLKK